MARGGRRQGQPGQSYANRRDLNVDRADQPGASTPQGQPAAQEPPQRILPDDIPNLTDPSASAMSLPDSISTSSLPTMNMSLPEMTLYSALQADPHNPALRRIRAAMQAKGAV